MYKRLFIIGNGFDLAHGFRTRYSDFRSWMIDEYCTLQGINRSNLGENEIVDRILNSPPTDIPSVSIDNHGEELVDGTENISFLLWLLINNPNIEGDWCNFEESLHDLDLGKYLEENASVVDASSMDREGDVNPFWQGDLYCQIAADIRTSVEKIKDLFIRWINSVDISNPSKLNEVISNMNKTQREESIFLSFNYTETLEMLYSVSFSQVNHIHGLRLRAEKYLDDKKDIINISLNNLIVGHGNDKYREFIPEHIEADSILERTISELRKDTEKILADNDYYWDTINNSKITEIYSFGFSYSDVDIPYIRKICNELRLNGNDVVWKLNSFDESKGKNAEYENIIRKCGFKGRIGRFG